MKKLFISTVFLSICATSIYSQSVSITPVNDELLVTKYGSGTPNLAGRQSNGSAAAPTASSAGLGLASFSGRGHTGSGFTSDRVGITMFATEAYTSTANGTRMSFYTTANGTTSLTERMRIDNSGNVGIGTTSPDKKLHVSNGSAGIGSYASSSNLLVEANTSHYIQMGSPEADETGVLFGKPSSSASGGVIYNGSNGMNFRTGGNLNRVTITSAGDVGIGTISPDTKLQVLGTVDNNGTDATFKVTNGASSMLFDGNEVDVASNGTMYLNYNSSGSIYLANGGGRVYIGNNGTGLYEVIKATVNILSFTVAANGCNSLNVSVTNAAVDSAVSCTPDIGLTQGLVVAYSRVSSAGNVLIRVCNYTGASITQNTSDYHIGIVR